MVAIYQAWDWVFIKKPEKILTGMYGLSTSEAITYGPGFWGPLKGPKNFFQK